LLALRKSDAARPGQQAHFRKRFTRQPHGHRAQRMDASLPGVGLAHQRVDLARLIQGGVGLRRQHQARHAAGQRRAQLRRREGGARGHAACPGGLQDPGR